MHRQTASVTHAPVRSQIDQALDRQLYFATKVAFYHKRTNVLTDTLKLGVGQILDLLGMLNARGFADFAGGRATDAKNGGKSDLGVLMRRNIDASDTGHAFSLLNPLRAGRLSLTLLLTRVGADNTYHAVTFNNFAVAADPLH